MKNLQIKPIEDCKSVVELLSHRSRWTKHIFEKYHNGTELISFCLMGAIRKIYSDNSIKFDKAITKTRKILQSQYGTTSITGFNDAFGRSYNQVLEIAQKAKI